LRYEGSYADGKKAGYGTIYNCNGSIAYEGEFEDDIPHGEGYIYDPSGNKLKRRWVKGIDATGSE
jgi:antitoxin component YwqK of YwqJK toxin-antitoxin module